MPTTPLKVNRNSGFRVPISCTHLGNPGLAGLQIYINDVYSLGLNAAQGMLLTEGFYWDLNDDTRAWSRRYFDRMKKMPNHSHAGVYSSVMHYLKSIETAGTDETAAVMRV